MTKFCSKCQLDKDISEFGKHKKAKDGLRSCCKLCNNQAARNWTLNNKEKSKLKWESWKKANVGKWKAAKKKWVQDNIEKVRFYKKKWEINNKDIKDFWFKSNPEKLKKYRQKYRSLHKNELNAKNRIYQKKNLGKICAKVRKRQLAKLQRTPKWLTEKHFKEIQEFYILAEELKWLNNGERLEVDHIVPLQGKNVSGLHVPWNLQIIPASMNQSKGNKY